MNLNAFLCKWPIAIVGGVRKSITEAVSGERGVCPLCGSELVARKGAVRAPHWWHINGRECDPWYENKGPWHRYWQNMFPEECQECVVEKDGIKHIADIRTVNGIVVEVQWSAISSEDISAREQFYDKMMWIVGMRRLEITRRMEKHFVEGQRPLEINGRRMHVFDECDFPISIRWLHCARPVFCDFGGDFENPKSDCPLYYIMPASEKGRSNRFCIEVSREELISALQGGDTRTLFQSLVNIRETYKRQKEAEREKLAVAERARQMQFEEALQMKERTKGKPYMSYADSAKNAIAFANRKFHTPPRCALTLGWIEAYLIVNGYLEHFVFTNYSQYDFPSFAPYGRIAIHCAAGYSIADYQSDCIKAKDCGFDCEMNILPYEQLKDCGDKIIGCVDYVIKHDGNDLIFTFQNAYMFYRKGYKAWRMRRSAIDVWELLEDTQSYLGYVDPLSSDGMF